MINPDAKKLRDEIVARADALLALVPEVADPPPPPPPPDPEPVLAVEYGKRSLNLGAVLTFAPWYPLFERYQRHIEHVRIDAGQSRTIPFGVTSIAAGGVAVSFPSPEYSITLSGIEIARVKPTGRPASFTIKADALPAEIEDGYHHLDCVPMDGAGRPLAFCLETTVPLWIVINRHGKAKDAPYACAQIGSFDVRGDAQFHWVKVPVALLEKGPVPKPCALDLGEPFTSPVLSASMYSWDIVPVKKNDHYTWTKDEAGVWNAASRHVYMYFDLEGPETWLQPSNDGPRGVGVVSQPTWLQPGRRGGVYFAEHSRVGQIQADGYVRTLAGYVYDYPSPHWQEKEDHKRRRKLVGDWSAVPENKRGFRGPWGSAWVIESLKTDESAAPIPNGGIDEKPHLSGPRLLVTRPRFGDVVEILFDPRSHETPAKVRVVISGLKMPWGIAEADGVLYIAEKGAHRILSFDANTYAQREWTFENDAPLPFVVQYDAQNTPRGISAALAKPHKLVAPEGLAYDGKGGLYYACLVQQEVRRVDIATKEVRGMAPIAITAKSVFAAVGSSIDGKTGPVGAFWVATYNEAANFGRPSFFLPESTLAAPKWWDLCGFTYAPRGVGGTSAFTYSMVAGMAYGVIAAGGADMGVRVWRKARADDPRFDHNQYVRDAGVYAGKGYELTHGVGGFGQLAMPLPWGEAPEIDRYLIAHGHTKP